MAEVSLSLVCIVNIRRTNQVGDPSTTSTLVAPSRLLRPPVVATYARRRGIGGPRSSLGRLAVRGLIADRISAPPLVPYCKEFWEIIREVRYGYKFQKIRTISRSAIFPSCPQVLWRSFGGALAHRFQSPIRSFEVWTSVVFPSIDSIGYRRQPGNVVTPIGGRLHKVVRDASGLKEDQGPGRTLMVVRVSGVSKIGVPHNFCFCFFQLVCRIQLILDTPVGRHRDRHFLAARLPTIHAPQRASHRSLIFSGETERPTHSCIARRAIVLLRAVQGRSEGRLHLTRLESWPL